MVLIRGKGDEVVGRVDFVPVVLTVAGVHPGVMLLRVHAKGHGGKKAVRLALADVVVRRGVAHRKSARRHRVVDLQGPDLRPRRKHFDADVASRHGAYEARDVGGAAVKILKRGRPRRHHLKAEIPVAVLRENQRRQRAARSSRHHGSFDKITALHSYLR
jgi:hypothetical protein